MSKITLSIIIVNYKSYSRLHMLLESITCTTNYEVIIINNDKNEQELLNTLRDSLRKTNKPIRIIQNRFNNGFAKACNQGAIVAKGSFLLFINPDIITNKSSINTLLIHASRLKVDVAGGRLLKQDGSLHRTVFHEPNILSAIFEFSNLGKILETDWGSKQFYYQQETLKQDTIVDGISAGFLLIRKKVFNELNGFDEHFFMYLEDVDLCTRLKEKNLRILYCPHATVIHEGGASSNNKLRINEESWINSRKYYFKKHNSLATFVLLWILFSIEEIILRLRK